MPRFYFNAEVERNVVDNVTLAVEAETFEEAREKAIEVAKVHPQPHTIEGVSHVYVENRYTVNSHVFNIERMVKTDGTI